jgi:hypothetical protein
MPQTTDVGVLQVRRIRDGTPGEYRRTDAERKGITNIKVIKCDEKMMIYALLTL